MRGGGKGGTIQPSYSPLRESLTSNQDTSPPAVHPISKPIIPTLPNNSIPSNPSSRRTLTPTKQAETDDMKVLRNASALLASQTIRQLMASATTNKTTSASSNGGYQVRPYTIRGKIHNILI